MLTLEELSELANWLNSNYHGDFIIDFLKGFDGVFVLVSWDDGSKQIHSLKEILSKTS